MQQQKERELLQQIEVERRFRREAEERVAAEVSEYPSKREHPR
jgi:hypothetical protein